MKTNALTPEQLHKKDACWRAAATAGVCRKHGINDAALSKWEAKFGRSDALRPKALEDRNARQEAR